MVKTDSTCLPNEVRSNRKLNTVGKDAAGDLEQFQTDGLLVSTWREKKWCKPVLVVLTKADPAGGTLFTQREQEHQCIVNVPCAEPVMIIISG